MLPHQIYEAARVLSRAEALVITAGAGMGVDSGLPDFRGTEGFWNAYPPFRKLGLNFSDLADPEWFERDPRLAWGFYGHRLNLYRRTRPHAGFGWLKEIMERCPQRGFVFTSNVDGQFQAAGFPPERIVECHGSIHRLQRIDESGGKIWDAGRVTVDVDETTMRAVGPLPTEPDTGILARPNILMFNDALWNPEITEAQHRRFGEWLAPIRGARLVVIEVGAGSAIPTVRRQSESLIATHHARLIRINPREPEVPDGQIGFDCGALSGLKLLNLTSDRAFNPP
jgi:NAD-dependent SIR2 family protein deacetylase